MTVPGQGGSGVGGRRPARGRRTRVSDPFRFDKALLDDLPAEISLPPDVLLCLAGTDEAGRGCLAGPLVAAAVVLDYRRASFADLKGLTDSKLLSSGARESMFQVIMRVAVQVTWVSCSPATIDTDGLHRCNLVALARALELLGGRYRVAVVDGFDLKRADLRARAVVGADFKSAAVGAASVVAKVVRDHLMRRLDLLHPQYGFAEHVGYGTGRHRQALIDHGPCCLHRLSFQGVGNRQLTLLEE